MLVVEFRRQVIHQINTLAATRLANQMALGDTQCTDHQLLLAARQNVSRVMGAESQAQVGTLWAGLGMAHVLITLQGGGEHFTEFAILVPATVIA
ncbi:hypothetical protein D9M71_471880 [compost metagenome]